MSIRLDIQKIDKFFWLILLSNIWIWKIFQFNLFIAIVCLLSSWFLYRSITDKKINKILLVFLLILVFFQIKTTNVSPLTELTQQEKLLQIQRMKEYPPVHFKILNKDIWIPAAHWLEERGETLSLYRIEKNLTDAVSLNLYFFANHPNERVGVKEFEKFPYILLPFFAIGFLGLDYKKNFWLVFSSLVLPLIVIAFIGQNNPTGPFSLFPFIATASFLGIKYAYERLKKYKYLSTGLFLFMYTLVLLQTILYERF